MPRYLCISLTFLDPFPTFHGRADGDDAEWPPSPLRVFQALVASAASRWRDSEFEAVAKPAFAWLERQGSPTIVAPVTEHGSPIRVAVPNNDLDVIASAWSRGSVPQKQPNQLKTMKSIRPLYLRAGEEASARLHYLWPIADDELPSETMGTIVDAARGITHLGWGIDMAAGHASILNSDDAGQLRGERWTPIAFAARTHLRSPVVGTLDALKQRYSAFLSQLKGDGYTSMPPLSRFEVAGYRGGGNELRQQFAAFSLLKTDASGFQPYHSLRSGRRVAGMMRHAVKRAAQSSGWDEHRIASFVLGHAEQRGTRPQAAGPHRFAYLPLPSIEFRSKDTRYVSAIRRVLVTVPSNRGAEELAWARRTVTGFDLVDEHSECPDAMLSLIPESDAALRSYVGAASEWSSVTPVILPGHDDRSLKKTDGLIRKAIVQAGLSEELARHADLDWRESGFLAGVELASKFKPPAHLEKFSRLHVSIIWNSPTGVPIRVPGPICLGGGRYTGIGLFAASG